MDNTTIAALQQAQELLKAGNKQEARAILMPLVRENQEIAEAWYLLGFALTDPEKRMYAFQQVLRIDPSNQAAQKQIAELLAAHAAAPVTEMPVAPNKQPQQKQTGSALLWGLAGMVAMLLCLIAVGGWWLSRNGLPVFQAPSPTALFLHPTAQSAVTPISRPTVTPYPPRPSSTPAPTTPTITPTTTLPSLADLAQILTAALPAPTVDATPNTAMFTNKETYWESAAITETKYGHLNAGESVSIPLDIDSPSEIIFMLNWSGKQPAVFTLTSPDGQLIDEGYAKDHPQDVTFGAASVYAPAGYQIKKPSIGLWEVHITASDAGNYAISGLFSAAGLTLSAGNDTFSHYAGDIATIGARLEDKGVGLAGATVTAIVGFPDSTVQTLILTDLGNGRYAAAYQIPDNVSGYVSFNITAKGSNHGVKFTRYMPVLLTVASNDIKLTGEYTDHLGDQDGEKTLDVEIGVDSGHAGQYIFHGQLNVGDSIISTTAAEVSLVPGHNRIILRFRGYDFRFWHLDGPYTLAWVSFDSLTGTDSSPFIKNVWQTAPYHWKDFGPELCYTLTTNVNPDSSAGSITIGSTPNCANGQYIANTLVTLTASANPGFQFKYWDGDMAGINRSLPTITLRMYRDMLAEAFFEKKP